MRGVGRGTSLSTAARFRTPWNMCGTLYRETGPPVWEGNTQGLLPLFPSAFEKRPSGRQMAKYTRLCNGGTMVQTRSRTAWRGTLPIPQGA